MRTIHIQPAYRTISFNHHIILLPPSYHPLPVALPHHNTNTISTTSHTPLFIRCHLSPILPHRVPLPSHSPLFLAPVHRSNHIPPTPSPLSTKCPPYSPPTHPPHPTPVTSNSPSTTPPPTLPMPSDAL